MPHQLKESGLITKFTCVGRE